MTTPDELEQELRAILKEANRVTPNKSGWEDVFFMASRPLKELIKTREAEAYKKGYIDGGMAEKQHAFTKFENENYQNSEQEQS